MASTMVDNFTITDTVNSSSYTSNIGSGTVTIDNYAPTGASTHTIPTGLRLFAPGALLDDGFSQKSLYSLLKIIQVNWDTAMSSLDDSSGVNTATFEAGCALGDLEKTNLIYKDGIGTDKLATFLQKIATQFAACTALLDADDTLTDTNYASTLDIKFSAKTGWVPPLTTSTAFSITSPASKIKTTGIHQEALIDFLNTVVTNINALWVKLDADI